MASWLILTVASNGHGNVRVTHCPAPLPPGLPGNSQSYCWWKKSQTTTWDVKITCISWDQLPLNWCRISSIKHLMFWDKITITGSSRHVQFLPFWYIFPVSQAQLLYTWEIQVLFFFFVAQLVFFFGGGCRSVKRWVATVYVVHHRFWTSTLECCKRWVKAGGF